MSSKEGPHAVGICTTANASWPPPERPRKTAYTECEAVA